MKEKPFHNFNRWQHIQLDTQAGPLNFSWQALPTCGARENEPIKQNRPVVHSPVIYSKEYVPAPGVKPSTISSERSYPAIINGSIF
jgi:hypothetical protein